MITASRQFWNLSAALADAGPVHVVIDGKPITPLSPGDSVRIQLNRRIESNRAVADPSLGWGKPGPGRHRAGGTR